MSLTSVGGRYRFGFQAVSISPARKAWASSKLRLRTVSLKRSRGKEIFLQSKYFLLNRGVIRRFLCLK
jgi:hypothetical protein